MHIHCLNTLVGALDEEFGRNEFFNGKDNALLALDANGCSTLLENKIPRVFDSLVGIFYLKDAAVGRIRRRREIILCVSSGLDNQTYARAD